jgi:hypothetical protein
MKLTFEIDDKDAQRIIDGLALKGEFTGTEKIVDEFGVETEVEITKENFIKKYLVGVIKSEVIAAEESAAFQTSRDLIEPAIRDIVIS